MAINITSSAKSELQKIMSESEYKKPALRLVFAGVG